eukprot:TRINITY_DN4181_c0_g1_i1.p1 TRINITY_DN4181_c0_g1~~TRINITY_DN4181_c0_g1_i1.p1  ORF type:complete len:215 (-),score=-16.66 TRINITY_DN4181_c0_g1_i1:118-762(-)
MQQFVMYLSSKFFSYVRILSSSEDCKKIVFSSSCFKSKFKFQKIIHTQSTMLLSVAYSFHVFRFAIFIIFSSCSNLSTIYNKYVISVMVKACCIFTQFVCYIYTYFCLNLLQVNFFLNVIFLFFNCASTFISTSFLLLFCLRFLYQIYFECVIALEMFFKIALYSILVKIVNIFFGNLKRVLYFVVLCKPGKNKGLSGCPLISTEIAEDYARIT